MPVPANMLDEIRRDTARLAMVREYVDAIERTRLVRLEQAPAAGLSSVLRFTPKVGF
jgi:transposase